ncbi:peptidyl-prolyl cis-trans isomerase CYP37, chloroplastic-like isoform X1 [Chenopodium quinoa]|uniref:peptidyl-prolyl cis-trans isomerase CYP37, chloroplastic-like isoform X1 n=1 Tax=Chenopodium quinoa TaxID=63459 RepID=UPI000B770F48|nr:peptidyl-prolyl cis-trans isomerase CYP37, chloroplastic-like isoform X1 [Chenopodium quinoa]
MASQLSYSPIFLSSSPKISMNSQFTSPLHRHFLFPRIQTIQHSTVRRVTTHYSLKESTDQHGTSYTPMVKNGLKGLQRTLAAVLLVAQISTPLPIIEWGYSVPPAKAVLYSPDTKVPRTGELALRRAIPANSNMKTIQESLEELSYLLRIPQRKPYGTMEGNVKKALKVALDEKESILGSMPADSKEKGSLLYASLIDGKGGLRSLLDCIKEKDADRVSVGLASSLDTVAELELLQAPGISFLLPQQYSQYPRLNGRGTVEFVIEKGDGSTFTPQAGGEAKNTATIQVVIDGYSAPLTAGNFAKLLMDGTYDGTKLNCTTQAVLSDNKLDANKGYSVPLELMPSGQFEPLYKTTLSVQDGELPVLPLSVYGAVVMAHSDSSEEYSSPNQFFFYLYDKRNAGLGGLSFDEGQFSVFGYTIVGQDILPQIKTGDIIRSAKLVEGQDRLILPSNPNST